MQVHQVAAVADLAGGVPADAERQVLRAHAFPIVRNAYQAPAGLLQFHVDTGRAGIQRVLHQLFHHAGRPFDHLAGGDLVGDGGGQKVDAGHAFRGQRRVRWDATGRDDHLRRMFIGAKRVGWRGGGAPERFFWFILYK